MDLFSLVDALRSYCTNHNWHFIYGNDAYTNAQADNKKYNPGDLIMVADFSVSPVYAGGRVIECQYQGVIMLGRKNEAQTKSTLDETPIQKYDRRLKDLTLLLANACGDIACSNELEITSANFKMDMNKFDLNADFVAGSITFVQ